MSALGHKRTCALQLPMSALPPKADMKARWRSWLRSSQKLVGLLGRWPNQQQDYPEKDWRSAAFRAVVVAVLGAKRIQRSCPAGCTAEVGLRWWAACPP